MAAPASPIAVVEAALLARLRAVFGARVREVAPAPKPRLDEAALERVLRQAPGLYVAFLGGPRDEARPGLTLVSTWGVYCVAANAAGAQAQREGDGRTIGAWQMLCLAAALDRLVVEGVGTVQVTRAENLFTEGFVRAGRSVYALTAEIPIALPPVADPATALDDFATFAPDWDVPPFGGEPDARDHYALGRAR